MDRIYLSVLSLMLVAVSAGSGQAEAPQYSTIEPDIPSPRQPSSQEFEAVLKRLEATERQLQQLSASSTIPTPLPTAENPYTYTAEALAAPATNQPGQAVTGSAAPQLADKPKFPTAKLTGFFHLDDGYFSQDPANRATLGDIQDGVGFRRARLQAVGSVAEFTNYSIEMDFATPGRPSFMDVWGEQTHVPVLGNVRAGHYRQPLSMESWTSIRSLWFLERSLPFQAFDPFRRVGVMAYDKSDDELTTWAYSLYRTGGFNNAPLGDSRFGTDIGDEGGVSVTGRLTHLLWYDEPAEGRYLLHIGGAYDYSRNTGSTANAPYYQARAIPEFFVGDPAGGGNTIAGTPFFVDTGRLASEQFQIFNLQLAGQYGAAHFQAEYFGTMVDQTGNPDVYYDGAYAQAGYFLTGENWTYSRTYGVFDKVVPYSEFFSLGRKSSFCGWGAWEATARWSYVNLNDPDAVPIAFAAGPPPSPNPGSMNNLTFGLNWYWNSYAKLQFNYIHAFLDNAVTGDSDCDIFCGRFQVAF